MTTTTLNYYISRTKAVSFRFPSINWKLICIVGIAISSMLLVFYVLQINQLTSGTYLIKNFQKDINNITEENKTLEMNFAKTSFLGSVEEKTSALGFEKTKEVSYIQVLDSSVAITK